MVTHGSVAVLVRYLREMRGLDAQAFATEYGRRGRYRDGGHRMIEGHAAFPWRGDRRSGGAA